MQCVSTQKWGNNSKISLHLKKEASCHFLKDIFHDGKTKCLREKREKKWETDKRKKSYSLNPDTTVNDKIVLSSMICLFVLI